MTDKIIPNLCPPCEPIVEFTPKNIPDLCPKPIEEDKSNSHLYPTSKYIEIQDDCFLEMLTNMVNNKFCKVGPRCCDK